MMSVWVAYRFLFYFIYLIIYGDSMGLPFDEGFKNKFDDKLRGLVQQAKSKLMPLVNYETIDGEYTTIDKLGKFEVRKDNSIFAPVQNFQPSFNRRLLSADRFVSAAYFDTNRMNKLMNDEVYMNDTISAIKKAFERKIDKVIIDSLYASVRTGKNGLTVITPATDGVVTINATSGITYEVLRNLRRTFASKGWSRMNGHNLIHVMTEQEQDAYGNEIELLSADYSGGVSAKRNDYGELAGALGFEFQVFPSEPLESNIDKPILDVTSSVRDCFAFVGKTTGDDSIPASVSFGMERKLEWDFDKVVEKHDTYLFKAQMNMGAVREDGSAVIRIQTPEDII